MKASKLCVALACVVALAGCKSSKPKEDPNKDKPPETAGTNEDKQKLAGDAYDAAVKAEMAGEFMKARDGYLKVKTYSDDYKDTNQRLANLEEVIVVEQKIEGAPGNDPKRSELMVDLADAFRKRGELDRAMDEANKALEANPTLAVAHTELAAVNFEAGWCKESADQAQKAVDADPSSADGYYRLAFVHKIECFDGADRTKALEFAKKAASLAKPNDSGPHELLAECFRDGGDMDKALAELKAAVQASGGAARLQKKYEAWGGKPDAPPPPAEKAPDAPKAEAPPAEMKPEDKPAEPKPEDKPAEPKPEEKQGGM
ncbi:MAG TPA: hypothetical protein VFF73_06840 [Planctomycetota bacterium]|nr:hypothetical protein [Planctomycetota bacterium]